MSYIRIQKTSHKTMLLHRLFQVSIVTVTLPWLCRSGAVRRLISVWTKLRGATSITKRLVGRSVGWSVLRWLAPLLPSCHSWWVRLARSVVSDPRSKCRCVGIVRRQRASTSRCRRKKNDRICSGLVSVVAFCRQKKSARKSWVKFSKIVCVVTSIIAQSINQSWIFWVA